MCFVERKTHRESWKGEESVKERFTLPEPKMVPFLEGEYTVEQACADLRAKVRPAPACTPSIHPPMPGLNQLESLKGLGELWAELSKIIEAGFHLPRLGLCLVG